MLKRELFKLETIQHIIELKLPESRMKESIHTTQVDLDGLLEVLGRNLYSTPSVALRELVQNAHDACERYTLEVGEERSYAIELVTNQNEFSLIIRDNGSGLTQQEIQDYLATIGTGYTRLLRNSTESSAMIGYFGLGFLSAYVVATRVEVVTRSYQTMNDIWKFTSIGGKQFTLKAFQGEEREYWLNRLPHSGTEVKIFLNDEFEGLSNPSLLESLVQKYCCLLPIPIFIDKADVPANNLVAPWSLDDSVSPLQQRKKQLEFAQLFEGDFEPICCITIPKDNPYQLSGIVWIQDGSSYSSSDNRNVTVFIRNMYITDEIHELLPRWAGFMGGVFESSRFTPTASREGLQKNNYYYDVIAYIKEVIVTGLRDIVLRQPEAWRRVLARHNQSLLGAALGDERLFEVTHKSLKVPTSEGMLTLPQLLKNSDGQIYIKQELAGGYEETLCRAKMIPLVLGYLYAASQFCRQYGRIHDIPVRMLGMDDSETTLFEQAVDVDDSMKECIEELFQHPDEAILFTRFEPHYIPLVVIEDEEVKLKKRLEEDEADKRISSAALSLARLHTKTINKEKERRVYINVNNILICQLPVIDEQKRRHLSTIIRSYMDSLHQQVTSADTGLTKQLEQFNQALLGLAEIEVENKGS